MSKRKRIACVGHFGDDYQIEISKPSDLEYNRKVISGKVLSQNVAEFLLASEVSFERQVIIETLEKDK